MMKEQAATDSKDSPSDAQLDVDSANQNNGTHSSIFAIRPKMPSMLRDIYSLFL